MFQSMAKKKEREREKVDCGECVLREFLPGEGRDTKATTKGVTPTHYTS